MHFHIKSTTSLIRFVSNSDHPQETVHQTTYKTQINYQIDYNLSH
jgi:hypothetical protein